MLMNRFQLAAWLGVGERTIRDWYHMGMPCAQEPQARGPGTARSRLFNTEAVATWLLGRGGWYPADMGGDDEPLPNVELDTADVAALDDFISQALRER